MTDFFDLPEDAFSKPKNAPREKKTDPHIYDPDPNAFNGSYKSVFRFIPYVFDKTKSKYTKYSAKIWNPLTKESTFVDCPSNVGDPSILWTIETVLKSIKTEEPELHKELSNNFGRWYTHHSLIYVKKDPQRPELEDNIKVFKFRHQIDELIEQQLHPQEDSLIEGGAKKINPFHMIEGRDFLCIVGKKTKEFRDWSKCKFMEEVTPFVFKVDDKTIKVTNDEKSAKLSLAFLTKNSPKMDEYYHQAWTEETYVKVAEAIVAAISNKHVLNMVLEKSKDSKMNALIKAKLNPTTSNNPTSGKEENLEFEEKAKPTASPKKENKIEEPIASSETGDDEYDDLFKNL